MRQVKDLYDCLYRSRDRESPLVLDNLPTNMPPMPNVTFPVGTLKRFADSYRETSEFVAWVCGVSLEKLCRLDMLVFIEKRQRESAKLSKLLKVNEIYREALDRMIRPCAGQIGCDCLSGMDCANVARDALKRAEEEKKK